MSNHQTPPLPDTDGCAYHLRAAAVLIFIVLNLSFWLCPLMVLILLKWMLPLPGLRKAIYRIMARVYQLAVECDSWILFRVLGIQLEVEGLADTYPEEFYLVTSNHQSWSDIFILQHLLNRKAPIMKFLVKRELIYLPLVGLICWAYDFPFLRRRRLYSKKSASRSPQKKDTAVLKKALSRFMRSTAVIMNFVEGTRYSSVKARRQKSPYRCLLKPKSGGIIAIVDMLGSRLAAIVDFTIVYHTPTPNFWRFIGGNIQRITVHVKTIMVNDLFKKLAPPGQTVSPATISAWINQHWELKDKQMTRIMAENRYPGPKSSDLS